MVSVEAVEREFNRRLCLNRQILKKLYWKLPFDDVGHEDFIPVGRGIKTSPLCAKWTSVSVCKDVEAHKGKVINGVDCTGKVVVRNNHMWCHKSSCPACFIRGWSVREARSMDSRLSTAVKRGIGDKIEHVMVSVAVADRDLPESVMRKKCREALADRGVIGAGMIFHGFRINKERNKLVWSPHYHTLGFIKGGFDRCRSCVHERGDCRFCDGFKGREVRGIERDGYLVKVEGERKTVFGTAWYQLNHATIKLGITERFHVVTWFGVCGNRKFKSDVLKGEVLCPACGGEMVKSMHMGERHIVKDIGHVDYVPWFVDDEFDADGKPNYVEVVGSRPSSYV